MATPTTHSNGPAKAPLLRKLIPLLRDPLTTLQRITARGPVVKLGFGRRGLYLINRPELARDAMIEHHWSFERGGPFFDGARLVVGNGLVTCPNADARRQRPLLQPAFQRTRTADYHPMMREQIAGILDAWQPGEVIDVSEQTRHLSMAVLTHTMLTSERSRATGELIRESLPTVMDGLFRRVVLPIPALYRLPTPGNRRFDRVTARLFAAISETVAHYRRDGADRGDLMSLLMDARAEDGSGGLSDAELRDQVMTLLLAGVVTVTDLVAWTLHVVAGHPEVERRLFEEIDAVLDGRVPDYEDLKALPYTHRVLMEVLRLWPPTWILSRKCVQDVVLDGTAIPAGSQVAFSLHAVHRDASVFPSPRPSIRTAGCPSASARNSARRTSPSARARAGVSARTSPWPRPPPRSPPSSAGTGSSTPTGVRSSPCPRCSSISRVCA